MDAAIEMENVCKSYGDFRLEDISLQVPRGAITGFIGENGAGKTTTIKLMLNLIRRDSGLVRVLGEDSAGLPRELKEHIGVVLDESCFPENLSAREVEKILSYMYRSWDGRRFRDLLKSLGLPEKKIIRDYSRGMKTKLTIAAAMSHDTRLLILDEPTSGLDPLVRDEILDLFMDFIQQEDRAVFLSSHVISDLEKACDYITLIHQGKLLFSSTKDDLLETYGIARLGQQDLENLNPSLLMGIRKGSFGAEALVERRKIPAGVLVDPARLEDIMVYHVREARNI